MQTFSTASGRRQNVAAPSSIYFDDTVHPGHVYLYRVTLPSGIERSFSVQTPRVPPATLDAIRGKGISLYFSSNSADPNYIGKWNVKRIIAQARAA